MLPITLNTTRLRLAIAGNGALAVRRLLAVRRAGASAVVVFADAASPGLRDAAGAALRESLPDGAALADLHAIWIADLPDVVAAELAAKAQALRVLVNVEDRPALCDFHSVAEIRRGDLLLTVSTNGAAPGLAGSIRRNLENCFGPEWEERVSEIAALRAGWRQQGVAMPEAARRIDTLVAARCWLSCPPPH